jgi:hypothetical protein
MANENLTAETWFVSVLGGDAAGVGERIFDGAAPRGTAFPLIVFQWHGGHDVRGVGPARIMTSGVYLVRAIGQVTSYATLKPIAEAIDQLLQGASGTTVDGTVIGCVREQPYKKLEVIDDQEYRHLGGFYRLWVQ